MNDFPLARLEPDAASLYAALGLQGGAEPSARAAALLPRALETFRAVSEPRGMSRTVAIGEFAAIFAGTGRNEPQAPLAGIYPRAQRLELFAFTLGERISAEIARLFAGNDFALGSVLDAMASLAADNAGRLAEARLESRASAATKTFLYSPGYCGWHISAQAPLFAALRPQAIGMTLNASFLMSPLKSISGVLVSGPAAIHGIAADYPFCACCPSPVCRERRIGVAE
jgi:hypothetical protein